MRPLASWLIPVAARWLPGVALIGLLCFPGALSGGSGARVEAKRAGFTTSISQRRSVRAGSIATVRVRVANTGNVTDRYEASLVPPAPGRVVKRAQPFELAPSAARGAVLRWQLPKGYAGRTHVQVRVIARTAAARVRAASIVVRP